MKLTNEALTKMILEEINKLDEKFSYPDNSPLALKVKQTRSVGPRLRNIGLNKNNMNLQNAFNKIRNLDKAPKDLSGDDVMLAIQSFTKNGPKVNTVKIVKAIIGKMTGQGQTDYKQAFDTNMWLRANYLKKTDAQQYMFDQNFEPTKDQINDYALIDVEYETAPKIPSAAGNTQQDSDRVDIVGFDMRNAGSNEGQYPKALRHVFSTVFGSTSNFLDRLKTITNFTETMIGAITNDQAKQKLQAEGFGSFIKHTMALDYISSIVIGMESGSGAYQFESFLALIAGGKVEGKATSDVGGMGATDFTYGDNTKGSAKYYAKASGLEQSARGFKLGDEIHYVVALKRGDDKLQISGGAATITQLDIYYLVMKREPNTSDGKAIIKILAPDGQVLDRQQFAIKSHEKTDENDNKTTIEAPDGHVEFSGQKFFSDVTRQGSIKLLKANTSSFKETIRDSATRAGFADKLEAVEDSFSKSRDMKNSLVVYTTSDTTSVDSGNDLVDKHDALKASLKELLTTLTSEEEAEKITENEKLTEEILDKLIKAVIL